MGRLAIRCPGMAEYVEKFSGDRVMVGRGQENDVAVADGKLSRTHCRLEQFGDGYRIVDLGSANGTRVNGEKITDPRQLLTGDLISIGNSRMLYIADTPADRDDDDIAFGQTVISGTDGETAEAGRAAPRFCLQYLKGDRRRLLRLTREPLTIGRHKSCGLIFSDSSVSICHARIEFRDGVYVIHDLGSTNGIRVNGQKAATAVLRPGARIRIGKITLGFKELVKRPPRNEDDSRTPATPATNDTSVAGV